MSGQRVLVVDDSEIVFSAFQEELGKAGFNVDTALSCADALHSLQSNKYDLIFVDLVMPQKDGFETCKEIKKLYPDSRIILITGKLFSVLSKLHLDYLKIGNRLYYLYKPFLDGEILGIARQALRANN